MKRKAIIVVAACALAGLSSWWLSGCEGAQGPSPKARTEPTDTPAPAPRNDTSTPQAAAKPDETAPEESARDDEPLELPDYLVVLERLRPKASCMVRGREFPPSRLELLTENVSRLKIVRRKLALQQQRSIVIQIDGQGIEWTPKVEVVELVRTPSGIWKPVPIGSAEP